MKYKLTSVFLLFSLVTFAQVTDISDVTNNARFRDRLAGTPRQRVSTLTSLTLTENWQTIAFISGASSYNMNTFPQTRWDYANNKLLMNPENALEQAYDLSFDYTLNNVKGQSKIQMRFVVPAPAPFYFPFPDDALNAYVDISEVNMPGLYKRHFQYPIYTSVLSRTYGLQIQVRAISFVPSVNILNGALSLLSTVLSGSDRVVMTNSSLNIYSK